MCKTQTMKDDGKQVLKHVFIGDIQEKVLTGQSQK